MKRTPLKRGTSVLKRTPLKPSAAKKPKEDTTKRDRFFMQCWNDGRRRVCFETGVPLFSPLSIYFHHILEKEIYPQYEFCAWNIVLVSLETHDNVHRSIELCPKIKKYKERVLELIENKKL